MTAKSSFSLNSCTFVNKYYMHNEIMCFAFDFNKTITATHSGSTLLRTNLNKYCKNFSQDFVDVARWIIKYGIIYKDKSDYQGHIYDAPKEDIEEDIEEDANDYDYDCGPINPDIPRIAICTFLDKTIYGHDHSKKNDIYITGEELVKEFLKRAGFTKQYINMIDIFCYNPGLYKTCELKGKLKHLSHMTRLYNWKPSQIMLIDDSKKNLSIAKANGYKTLQFKGPCFNIKTAKPY